MRCINIQYILQYIFERYIKHIQHTHASNKSNMNNELCIKTGRSAVVIALRFGTQGPGFEPGLFHKACYMPIHGC